MTTTARQPIGNRLPQFPWDRIEPFKQQASAHAGGLVDLSIGTPVDPTPEIAQHALTAASDSPGYPTVWGTPDLRDAIVAYCEQTLHSVPLGHASILPTIGSKELVAGLPTQLGLGPGDRIVIPEIAYPTYEAGALIAGCDYIASDSTVAVGPGPVSLIWLNSPSNPTGRVLGVEHLRKVVDWARSRGVIVASDECYFECGWEGDAPVSVLDERVNGGSLDGLLAFHSLSKRSNLAGYRAGFVAGDPALVTELLEVRKHWGFMMPRPTAEAMRVVLGDTQHVEAQRERYLARRALLRPALTAAGFRIDHSEASLYLWSTRDEPCMDTMAWLAERGILAAPGDFYGSAGGHHVRIGLTATDERVAAAVDRLTS